MDYLFSIKGTIDDIVYDEGIIYKKNDRYYIQWIGLGVTKRISERKVTELANSDLRIAKTCSTCKYLSFSDCYGECDLHCKVVNANNSCDKWENR